MDAFHLPTGLVAESGHASICPGCDREIVVMGRIGADLLTLEEAEGDPERPASLRLRRDQVDGRGDPMSLRLHACPDPSGASC